MKLRGAIYMSLLETNIGFPIEKKVVGLKSTDISIIGSY